MRTKGVRTASEYRAAGLAPPAVISSSLQQLTECQPKSKLNKKPRLDSSNSAKVFTLESHVNPNEQDR